MTPRSFLKYWLPVVAWMIFIFIGSTDLMSAEHTSRFIVPFLLWLKPDMSPETIARIHMLIRKLGHVTEYGILAALSWRALRARIFSQRELMKPAMIVLLISASYAALDEFHQSFIPTRTASENDVLIDVCGGCIGLVLCFALNRVRARETRTT
jgi:VanZ family protein